MNGCLSHLVTLLFKKDASNNSISLFSYLLSLWDFFFFFFESGVGGLCGWAALSRLFSIYLLFRRMLMLLCAFMLTS